MDFALKKKWKIQSEEIVKTQMSQKLGEMKRNMQAIIKKKDEDVDNKDEK